MDVSLNLANSEVRDIPLFCQPGGEDLPVPPPEFCQISDRRGSNQKMHGWRPTTATLLLSKAICTDCNQNPHLRQAVQTFLALRFLPHRSNSTSITTTSTNNNQKLTCNGLSRPSSPCASSHTAVIATAVAAASPPPPPT
eukprot:scaffold127101_cov22-Tisochrysis_lutea.AAC.2